MAVYKVEIKPETSFVGSITSNTLFGALCFSIRDTYGEDVLEEIFSYGKDGIVVSNLFPYNTLPYTDKLGVYKDIDTWVLVKDYVEKVVVTHNMSRSRGGEIGESKKWSEIETWSNRNYDFYIKTSIFDKEEIEQLIKIALINGLGRGRSRGKGQFRLIGIEEVIHIGKEIANPNGYMILSDYIPEENDSTNGIYTARVYRGATRGIKKTPIILINAGSRFIGKIDENYVGVVGKNYFDKITSTYISGTALVIPVRL